MAQVSTRELYVQLCQEPIRSSVCSTLPLRAHQALLVEIAELLETTVPALVARTRTAAGDERRQIAMWLLRRQQLSSVAIGQLLQRDHSTVLHGVAVVEARRRDDPAFADRLDVFAAGVGGGQ